MKMRYVALATALLLASAVTNARAVTFFVTGTSPSGDTLTGTLEADAALTNVTAVNLMVSGPGPVPDGLRTTVNSYVSPHLSVGASNIHVYLSFAGGPTPSEIDALIMATWDPALCGDNELCELFVLAQRSASFSSVATPAAVPLPAALPLFATVIAGGGLIAWRRKRKTAKLATR